VHPIVDDCADVVEANRERIDEGRGCRKRLHSTGLRIALDY
jgi:hypothetical protein